MVTPPYLTIGDTVGIVSTARKISSLEVQPLINLLKNWGLKYVLGDSINATDHQFAGDISLRAKDFQEMLDNSKIKAIW
jgi:muramoyltetrapeptide carboxypeptidase